jgi:hypothetical protein
MRLGGKVKRSSPPPSAAAPAAASVGESTRRRRPMRASRTAAALAVRLGGAIADVSFLGLSLQHLMERGEEQGNRKEGRESRRKINSFITKGCFAKLRNCLTETRICLQFTPRSTCYVKHIHKIFFSFCRSQ